MNDNMNKEQGPQESPVDQNSWQKTGKMCGHGMCCHGHRHFWLRWLLGIIILVAVFAIGVKVGEFKGEFGQGFGGYRGHQMMRYYPGQAYPYGMMQGLNGTSAVQGNAFYMMKQVPATTTPAK